MSAVRASTGTSDVTVAVSRTLREMWFARQVPAAPPRGVDRDRDAGQPCLGRIRLRRDGARPLVFDGSVVVSRTCTGPALPQGRSRLALTLYRTSAGALVGAAAAEVPDRGANRPVHLAAEIAAPEHFGGLLDAFASALGEETRATDRDFVATARRLVADLATGLLNPSSATATVTKKENEVSDDLHD